MINNKKIVGLIGEKLAATYLQKSGYQIVEKNFASHWGEIDLIAKNSGKIVFIEVKTRIGLTKGYPYEAVNYYKRRSLKRAIQHYLLKNKLKDYKLSLGIISIILKNDHSLSDIKYYENIEI